MDKLKLELDQAIDEFNLNSELRKEVFFKIKDLNKQMAEYEIKSRTLGKIIQEYKDMIACGNLGSTPGFDRLTEQEQQIIINSMDKTDYSVSNPELPRYLDLDRLVQRVLDFKTQYPGWVLNSIVLVGSDNQGPPANNYRFTFKTPLGHLCTFE